jgi:thiol-disulfide isomerase/thioredoxin
MVKLSGVPTLVLILRCGQFGGALLAACVITSCKPTDQRTSHVADTVVVERLRVGQRLPPLTIPTLGPDSLTIGGAQPQPVTLLNVWATWCGPCIAEMPALTALQQRFASRGLRVAAVSVDLGDAEVKAFLMRTPLTMPIGRDPAWTTTAALGDRALPQNVLISSDGRVLYRAPPLTLKPSPLDSAIEAALSAQQAGALQSPNITSGSY